MRVSRFTAGASVAVRAWWADSRAVTSIEYALIASLIAVVIVSSVAFVGTELKATYQHVANCVATPSSCV